MLLTRVLVVLGLALRIPITQHEYSVRRVAAWLVLTALSAIYVAAYYRFLGRTFPPSRLSIIAVVWVDTILFSAAYALSGSVTSDLYLLLLLPLLTAAHALEPREMRWAFLTITVAFASTTIALAWPSRITITPPQLPFWEALVRHGLLRWFIFLLVPYLLSLNAASDRQRGAALQVANAQERLRSRSLLLLNTAADEVGACTAPQSTLRLAGRYASDLAGLFVGATPEYVSAVLLSNDSSPPALISPRLPIPEHLLICLLPAIRTAVTSRRPFLSEHAATMPDSPAVAILVVPIPVRSGPGAALCICHPSPSEFPNELVEHLTILAAHTAASLDNSHLVDSLRTHKDIADRFRLALAHAAGLPDVSHLVLSTLRSIVPFDRASLQRVEGETRRIIATLDLPEQALDPWLLRPVSEDPLLLRTLEAHTVTIIPDVSSDPLWTPVPATQSIRSWIGVPFYFKDTPIAFAALESHTARHYTPEHHDVLTLFVPHASSALQNAILLDALQAQVDEQRQMEEHLSTLQAYLDDHRHLALIGLVYGDSIHLAHNKLGLAKNLLADIQENNCGPVSDAVRASAKRALTLTNEYLRRLNEIRNKAIHEPPILPINLHKLLDDLLNWKAARSPLVVRREYRLSEGTIQAPAMLLRQLFRVIIQNAVDAMDGRMGTITATTEVLASDATFICVTISDTGHGIPLEKQATLFEQTRPIESEGRATRGTGMGLPWSRAFVHSYGGELSFTTSAKGTTMLLTLPRDFRRAAPIDFLSDRGTTS